MGFEFGSEILLDLVLFADRANPEPKSNRPILWDMGGLQRFERRVCIFLAVCFHNTSMHNARPANRLQHGNLRVNHHAKRVHRHSD